MKLWILEPLRPWSPWYDKAFGFVVRAETEDEARIIASEKHGDEGPSAWLGDGVTCFELLPGDAPGIIMRDFRRA